MIKFENTEVMNFEGAIRGMRNPLNSWDKSDTVVDWYTGDITIGPDDLDLMKRLIKAGSDHRKFMRQIIVSVDITAPLYWWKEFDTYKVATVSNSCSTMHTIHKKEFTRDDFSCEHLNPASLSCLSYVMDQLNGCRDLFLREEDKTEKKALWYNMIQLLPTSYNQRRTITLNYETLYNIYGSRRNHKLDEWSVGFMDWIGSLPYAEELIKNEV